MQIRIYDFANLPPLKLAAATSAAHDLLSKAGVLMDWREGDLEAAEAREIDLSACHKNCRPAVSTAGAMVVRILPKAPATMRQGKLGMALPFASRGVHVTLFADQVLDVARTAGVDWVRLLGGALAHEIGHMLLGSSEHGNVGIMRAYWSHTDYLSVAMGTLRFDPQQALRMREMVAPTRVALD